MKIIFILIFLFVTCIVVSTEIQTQIKESALKEIISSGGLKNFLQGRWKVQFEGMVEEGNRQEQIFAGDTLTIISYGKNGKIENSWKQKVEYYNNFMMSNWFNQHDTLYYFIESADSVWTVVWGDVAICYSRVSEDK